MDVMQAAYRVAHDFQPDGATGLARKLGQTPGTFLNRVNPEQDTHFLPVGLAVAMSMAANDYRVLHAFADTCGHLAFKKPNYSRVSDASLLEMVLQRDTRMGAFSGVIEHALESGDIDAVEMARIEETAYDLTASILEMVERLRGLRKGSGYGR